MHIFTNAYFNKTEWKVVSKQMIPKNNITLSILKIFINLKLRTSKKYPKGVNIMAEAYCVKCKAKKEIKGANEVTMKNGRKALKGTCPTCGTGMFRITGK